MVAQVSELGKCHFDAAPFVQVGQPESVLVIGTEGKPKGVRAGTLPDFGEDVRELRPAG